MDLLLVAVALQLLAGLAACVFSKWPRLATGLGSGGAVAGCVLGLIPTVRVLLGATTESLPNLEWDAAHGPFSVELDALSSFFLLPVLGLSALAAVYGGNYLLAFHGRKSLGAPWFFFNVFVAGMVLVLIARTAVLFLVAWEVMSLAAFCLVTFEHEHADVRQAGWIYLIATHLGAAVLVLMFVLLGRQAGSLQFEAFRIAELSPTWAGLIFVLALVGFGAKAGFVPFHVWLPDAHPAAPSHVSALMSGVMIKMGLYGILRVLTFLGPLEPWWGLVFAGVGLLTAITGIALALNQRDMKRVLAYSSIENMGLIALALGAGIYGWAAQLPEVGALGFTAAFLHIWNHAMMKGLMFLAAGSVLHGTGTKDVEKLGGLLKRMPWTGAAMMTGGVAIAALPPLNGFAGKFLLYMSLLKWGLASNDPDSLSAMLAVGLIALVGGLAAITFVRLNGIVLLGSPRTEAARHAHESSPWMLGPMAVLVVLCLAVAVFPQWVVGLTFGAQEQALGRDLSGAREVATAALVPVGEVNGWILVVTAALACAFLLATRKGGQDHAPTWGCGYARPTVRMQYTGRSFAEIMGEHLLPRFLRPRTGGQAVQGLFPGQSNFGGECPDPLTNKIYEPFFRRWAQRFARLRILQQGMVHVYLLYIVVAVMIALAWVSLRRWWLS